MSGPIFVAVRATALFVVACGGGTIGSTALGPSDSSSASGDGDAAPSSPDASIPCNDVPDPTGGAQVQFVRGVAPAPSGGAIRDGLYELASAVVYLAGTDAGPSIEGRAHAISISGAKWASVSYFDSAPTTRYNDEATLSGNTVALRRVCGSPGSGILFGAQGTYAASDSTLVLNFAAGAFGDGTAVLTFLRYPDADAAAPIGAPCANSYGCYLGDAGGPPAGIACGAGGLCVACNTNGLNDPCLGRPPNSPQGPDCCPGLRCVNSRCVL